MRRLASIAAFALLLAVPLWAQHGGGGRGGGGGHAGFSGGHSGGFGGHAGSGSFGGGHVSGGTRGASGFSGPLSGGSRGFGSRGFSSRGFTSRNFSRGPFLHDGFHGHYGHTHFYTYGFRNNCYGYRCGWSWGYGYGYPWWGSAYYDPWWWNQDDQQFNNDYYGQYDTANQMNEQSLAQQRMLRQEEADGDQDAYAPRAPERRSLDPAPSAQPQGSPIIPPTVLVFRDQHREETQNYAIVGQTLWNFTSHRTEKIALANLDLPATEKANDDRGVSFRIPGIAEGQ